MNLENFVMPILSMVVGVISLFTDPNNRSRRWLFGLLIVALVSTSTLEIFFRNKSDAQAEEDLKWSRDRIRELIKLVENVRAKTEQGFSDLTDVLSTFGWQRERIQNANVIDVQESLQAEKERQLAAAKTAPSQRKNITIQYFPKDVDREKVEAALQELGFRLVAGRTRVSNVQTNAIWFGKDVPVADVKLVAYTLMRAGVKIKIIRPFARNAGRDRVIQVGSDGNFINASPLTVQELRNKTTFERQVP